MYAKPPGPSFLSLLRRLPALRRDPLAFLCDLAQEYGDLVRLPLPGNEAYLLNHPDLIEGLLVRHQSHLLKSRGQARTKVLFGEGLLTSEGQRHLDHRRLIQPAFHKARLAAYGDIMAALARGRGAGWARLGAAQGDEEGVTLDMAQEMSHLTMAIVGQTLFGETFEQEAATISEAVTDASQIFLLLMLPFSEFLERLPLPTMRRFRAARGQLQKIVQRLIRERQERGEQSDDLLGMLLDKRGGQGLSEQEVEDEVMTIFLVGHDTLATALTWTWILLARHPAILASLQAELDELLGDAPPSAHDVPKLPYTRMVLAEAMRLYPPVWTIGRRVQEPITVAGYHIPVNSTLFASQWVMQHDARYYPNPYKFDPLRWTTEAEATRPRFSYFPFGGGRRICIGERFAWLEGTLILATLAQQWSPSLASEAPITPEPLIILRPRGKVMMRMRKRESKDKEK